MRFNTANGKSVEVKHPLTKAALLVLNEQYPDAIDFDELSTAAQELVRQAGNNLAAGDSNALQNDLFRLFSMQVVQCRTTPIRYPRIISERPRANGLALNQNASGLNPIAVAHHASLQLDPFSSTLLSYLDGQHSRDQLVQLMVEATQTVPELTALLNEQQCNDANKLTLTIMNNCQRLLELFARNGVLAE